MAQQQQVMKMAPQVVLIQAKGASGKLHLKTDKNPSVSRSAPFADRQITWQFIVPHATRARFWFPDESDLQKQGNKLFMESQREVDLTVKQTLTLTIDETCPVDTYPYTIFCDVKDKEFEQKGHQLVDGPNSHATTDVGP